MKQGTISALILMAVLGTLPLAYAAQRDARQGAKIYGNADRGKAVTAMWCANCHGSSTTANDRVPTFTSLAADPNHTDAAIRAFLMQPHKPMPPLELGTQQIEDIIAYLHTLRAPVRDRQ